jgi:hypothetical protein
MTRPGKIDARLTRRHNCGSGVTWPSDRDTMAAAMPAAAAMAPSSFLQRNGQTNQSGGYNHNKHNGHRNWDCYNRQTRHRNKLVRRRPRGHLYHFLIDTNDSCAWKGQSWNKIPSSKSRRKLVPWGSLLEPLHCFSMRHSFRYIRVIATASFEMVPTTCAEIPCPSHFDAGGDVRFFVDWTVRRAVDLERSNGRWH